MPLAPRTFLLRELRLSRSRFEVARLGVGGFLVSVSEGKIFLGLGGKARDCRKRFRRCFARQPEYVLLPLDSPEPEVMVEECKKLPSSILIVDFDSISRLEPSVLVSKTNYGSSLPILVLTDEESPRKYERLLRAGCMGFLLGKSPPWQIRRAVEAVASGEIWAPRKLLSEMCRGALAPDDQRRLTSREDEILELLGKGYKNREIGDALFISRETVRWHIRSIYSKLDLHDRQSLTRYGLFRKPPSPALDFAAGDSDTRIEPSQTA